jgi:hypothetical protein
MENEKLSFGKSESFNNCVEEIGGMIREMQALLRISLPEYTRQVSAVIRNKIRDATQIEHLLDSLLDRIGIDDDYLDLFKKLCRYYWDIDPAAVADYVYAYHDLYDSDGEEGEDSEEES